MSNGGTVWVLKVTTSIVGEPTNPILNVFTYAIEEANVTGAAPLATLFEDNCFTEWVAAISTACYISRLEVINLFDPGDFTIVNYSPTTYPGLVTGEALPKFNAVNLTLNRTNRNVRNGSKRIGMISETQASAGILTGAATTLFNALGTKFITDLEIDSTTFILPVIVKRVKITDIQTGEVTYELPDQPQEAIWYVIGGFSVSPAVTSQNTRKG